MSSPLTALDVVLIAVLLISGGLALLRGFTREVLSIIAWVSAALATLVLFPLLQPKFRELIASNALADIVCAVAIFLTILITVSLLTAKISNTVVNSKIGALDRTLGFIFGVARGLLLMVVVYLFFVWLVPPAKHPGWIANARSLWILRSTGSYILSWMPKDPSKALEKITGKKPAPATNAPPGPKTDGKAESGYRNSERRSLQQLLESTKKTQR